MNVFVRILIALAPLAVGSISGWATSTSVDTWYDGIEKPAFNPPNWLFGPVWTTLYILMGIGIFIILGKPRSQYRSNAITIFWIQLFLNGLWSFIFFNWHLTGWAFIEIVLLWIAIISMIYFFMKISRTAGLLQIPYLLWVSFASVLNGTIWYLNA